MRMSYNPRHLDQNEAKLIQLRRFCLAAFAQVCVEQTDFSSPKKELLRMNSISVRRNDDIEARQKEK